MEKEEYLTTKETAELLRVSHYTVAHWLTEKKLTRIKAGRRTLIARSDIDRYLKIEAVRNW